MGQVNSQYYHTFFIVVIIICGTSVFCLKLHKVNKR